MPILEQKKEALDLAVEPIELNIKLSELKTGTAAEIKAIPENEICEELSAIGLWEGQMVKMVSRAPLGDPLMISTGNTHIGINIQTAQLIDCQPVVS